MLARPPRWTFNEAAMEAEVEKIKAEMRARRQLAFNRRQFRERMMDSLEDYDRADGDRLANKRGN